MAQFPNISLDYPYGNETEADSASTSPSPNPVLQELSEIRLIDVVAYTFLFAIGAPANFKVLSNLMKEKLYCKTRHHLLLWNLTLADSVVSFVMIPTEIGWRLTNAWTAGTTLCKLFQFIRVFGPYASSMVLICISIDRYYAVVKPFTYSLMDKRVNTLLVLAWVLSFLFSLPQLLVFNVQTHPEHKWFLQCVNFDFFANKWHEKLYNFSSLVVIYFIPLLVILVCYSCICFSSFRRTHNLQNANSRRESHETIELETYSTHVVPEYSSRSRRQSTLRRNILKQTVIIIVAFIVCWTPYVFITIWYQIDTNSANKINSSLSSILFLFAVSNSSINPFIYGKFVKINQTQVL